MSLTILGCTLQDLGIVQEIALCLLNLGGHYNLLGDYQQAIYYQLEALKIFREIGNWHQQVLCLNNLGLFHGITEEHGKSFEYFKESLSINEDSAYLSEKAFALTGIAKFYDFSGEYQKALNSYQECLDIQQEISDLKGKAYSYLRIGRILYSLKQHTQAIQFLKKSLKICQVDDINDQISLLVCLGGAYKDICQYANSILYCRKALNFIQASNTQKIYSAHQTEAHLFNVIGEAHRLLKQHRRAIKFYQQSIYISEKVDNQYLHAEAAYNLGLALSEIDRKVEAIASFQSSYELFRALELDNDANELPRCKQTGYQNQKRVSCSSRCNLRYSLP